MDNHYSDLTDVLKKTKNFRVFDRIVKYLTRKKSDVCQKVKEEWVDSMTKLCGPVEGHLQVPLQKAVLPLCSSRELGL